MLFKVLMLGHALLASVHAFESKALRKLLADMTGQPADQMSPFRPARVSVTKQALHEATCTGGTCTWTQTAHLDPPLVVPNPWNRNKWTVTPPFN